ncbi:MAG TPA: DEAD/DEAH box helicase, partial [Candidatus Parcubacteria bacterium]|nr:DEAD/DEAH box helicase [Candidatus Parcubacteria bacterium]
MNLSTPIGQLPRIGPIYQRKLKRLGVKTVKDLFFHFPHRYEDFSNIIPVSNVKLNETCCIQGKILEIENTRTWRKKMSLTHVVVGDKTGAIKVIWYNQPYLIKTLKKGDSICLTGKMVLGKRDAYLNNPSYEKLGSLEDLTHTGRIVPVYPETEGLSSRWLRFILKPLLIHLKSKIKDPLPKEIIKKHKLLDIQKAIWQVHFPDSLNLAKKAQERFSFEGLFDISLFTLKARMIMASKKAPSIPIDLELVQRFVKSLSFKLTDAQKKSSWRILKDIEKPRPMNRLLEGDVGSGKTVVATMAALNVIKGGYQAAFMAPTEILAKQHFKTL